MKVKIKVKDGFFEIYDLNGYLVNFIGYKSKFKFLL